MGIKQKTMVKFVNKFNICLNVNYPIPSFLINMYDEEA